MNLRTLFSFALFAAAGLLAPGAGGSPVAAASAPSLRGHRGTRHDPKPIPCWSPTPWAPWST